MSQSTIYNIVTQLKLTFIISSFIFLSIFFSLTQGSATTHWSDLFSLTNSDIVSELITLRLTRTLTAFTTGGLLAYAGALMQVLLQNPLADPYILGISGGAAVMTLLSIVLGLSGAWLLAGAWAGSLLSILIIFALARLHHFEMHALVLTSICLACMYSAVITFLILIAPAVQMHSMLFWLTGDLNNSIFSWSNVNVFVLALLSYRVLAPGLNILARGDEQATLLGLATKPFKWLVYILSSLFTATAVANAGCIGFIGLIVPHISRRLIGTDHRHYLPITIWLGGALLTIADTLSRTLMAPIQLPVGMLLALFGAPTLIFLIRRKC